MDGAEVRSDVLTYCPIAPGGAYGEAPVLEGEVHRSAVDLPLGGVASGFYLGDLPSIALLPRGQLLGAEGVGKREHGPGVSALGECGARDRADALGWTVGALQLGMCGLERLELAEQPIVLGVR